SALSAAVPASTVVVVAGGLVVVVGGDFVGLDPKIKKSPIPNAAANAIAAKGRELHLKDFLVLTFVRVGLITRVSSPFMPRPTTPGIIAVSLTCSAAPS